MPTRRSKLTMESRKASYDQVSFLAPKGTRELLRILALSHGKHTTATDIMNRLILDAAGLITPPAPGDLAALAAVKTPSDAAASLAQLQSAQEKELENSEALEVNLTPDEWNAALFVTDQVYDELTKQNQAMKEHGAAAAGAGDITIWMPVNAVLLLKRVLSNTTLIKEDPAEYDDEEE